MGPQPGEYARHRVENLQSGAIRETISRRDAAGRLVHETWTNLKGEITRRASESTTGESPMQEFNRLRKSLVEKYNLGVAHLPLDDRIAHDLGLSHVLGQHANELENLLSGSGYLQKALGPVQAQNLQAALSERAAVLRARAGSLASGAQSALDRVVERKVQQESKRTVREQGQALAAAGEEAGHRAALAGSAATEYKNSNKDIFRTGAVQTRYFGMKATGSEEAARIIEAALAANPNAAPRLRRRMQMRMEEHFADARVFRSTAGGDDVHPSGEYGRFLAGLKAFTPMGMLANITKVSGWAAAVTMLYKSVELARYSLERFIEVGEQTARLDVVFRKVGGSTEELTSDILKLAAANATDTGKAMESATEWARLGLSRSGVAEATRVSLAAANVAHMKPEETTSNSAR